MTTLERIRRDDVTTAAQVSSAELSTARTVKNLHGTAALNYLIGPATENVPKPLRWKRPRTLLGFVLGRCDGAKARAGANLDIRRVKIELAVFFTATDAYVACPTKTRLDGHDTTR